MQITGLCLVASLMILLLSLWTQMLAEQVKALQCLHQLVTLESWAGTAPVSPSAQKKFSG